MSKFFLALLTTLAVGLLITAGCSSFRVQKNNPLDGTAWKLETYAGQPLLENTTFTAQFQDGDIRGSSGCNQYFGSYAIEGQNITITDLGWTEMACLTPEGLMEQERTILGLLPDASRYQREGDFLQISARGGIQLIFTETESH